MNRTKIEKVSLTDHISQLPVYHRNDLTHSTIDTVAEEQPVALIYNGIAYTVMMAITKDLEHFALGFSLTENIIQSPNEIFGIDIVESEFGVELQIELSTRRFTELKQKKRTLEGRTSCGLCGIEKLKHVTKPAPILPITQTFSFSHLNEPLQQLRTLQPIGNLTGCTHVAAWLSSDGKLLGGCEDVGRHIALDKLLGLRAKTPNWQNGALLISSRASYEMVQKAAMCHVEIIFAISAVTALAIEMAKQSQLTLVGFCGKEKATIYTHPERLTN